MIVVLPELRPWVWPWFTPYQRAGITKAVGYGDQVFWWTTGSGKTAGACAWAVASGWPVLTLCPPSVRSQWATEVRRFTTCEPFVLYPVAERKAGDMTLADYLVACRGLKGVRPQKRPWLIMGHNGLRDLEDELEEFIAVAGFFSLICDEVHRFKDFRRKKMISRAEGDTYEDRPTIAARLGRLAPRAARRLGLTATLIPDRLRDVWAQIDVCRPGYFGKSFWSAFAKRYCAAYEGTHGWITDGESNLDELRVKLEPVVHRVTKAELAVHLPPLRREIRWLDRRDLMGPRGKFGAEVRAAKAAVKSAARGARGGTGTEDNDNEATQVFLASRLGELGLRKSPVAAERIREALGAGLKVLCFTAERVHAEVIAKLVGDVTYKDPDGADAGVPVPIWCAHGEVTPRARETIREDYMAVRGPAAIIGTGEAWGESHNLQDTDLMLVVTTPWTWRQIAQWEGRPDRLGRERPLLIEFLGVEGTIEEVVLHKIMKKLKAVEELDTDSHAADVRTALKGASGEAIMDDMMDSLFGAIEEAA